ncbi:HNH endonuclease [Gordonia phage Daredevil]|uniref:HNH endonuclease n=1 Tax=Gordonia phage Daredevil TaxID=2283286 RepID=A0A345MIQ7_9CAUD|nr:HNH endonuclease [Gordonia phage Daredevil]AXH70438.1 HNH endonuclease [Gordonia phage Daredevil]
MKRCGRCKIDRPVTAFHKNRSTKDGLQKSCKSCVKEINRTYYLSSPQKSGDRLRSRNRARWAARLVVRAFKASHSCVDCGLRDRVVMEFDHVRGEKLGDLSRMANDGFGVEKILAEIAKCDLVCANCHRRRTASRAGWR